MSDKYAREQVEKAVADINRKLDTLDDVRQHVESDGGKVPDYWFDPMRRRFDVVPEMKPGGYMFAPPPYECDIYFWFGAQGDV